MEYYSITQVSDPMEIEKVLKNTYFLDGIDEQKKMLLSNEAPTIKDFTDAVINICDEIIPDIYFFGGSSLKSHVDIFNHDKIIADLVHHMVFSGWLTLKYNCYDKRNNITASHLFDLHYMDSFHEEVKRKLEVVDEEDYQAVLDDLKVDIRKDKFSNFSKNVNRLSKSPISKILSVEYINDKEYSIPNFQTPLLFVLARKANSSPYHIINGADGERKNYNYNRLSSYRTKLYGELDRLSKGNDDVQISNYIIERLFNVELINKITLSFAESKGFVYSCDVMAKCFSLLALLPNLNGRIMYIEWMLKAKEFNSLHMNKFDSESRYWDDKIIAEVSSKPVDDIQKQNLWLGLCEKFIMYMYSYCIPIVENCFYMLILHYFSKENDKVNINAALEYLSENIKNDYEVYKNRYEDLPIKLSDKEQKIFSCVSKNIFELFNSKDKVDDLYTCSKLVHELEKDEKKEMRMRWRNVKMQNVSSVVERFNKRK